MSLRMAGLLTFILLVTTVSVSAKVKLSKIKLDTAKQVKAPKKITSDIIILKRIEVQKFDNASFGTSISYQEKNHPYMVITYYIYPMEEADIPAELMMTTEQHNVKTQVINAQVSQGNQAKLITDELIYVGDHKTLFTKHFISGQAGELVSDTYLTNMGYHYLKLRISFPRSTAIDANPISAFLANALIKNTSIKNLKNTSLAISLNGHIEDAYKQTVMLMQLGYSAELMNAIETHGFLLDFEHIKRAIELVAEISDRWVKQNTTIENLLYFNDVKNAGYLDEFIWTYMKQSHWDQPAELDLSGFTEWFAPLKNHINPLAAEYGRIMIDY